MSELDRIIDIEVDSRDDIEWAIACEFAYGSTACAMQAADKYAELRRLVAVLTTEPLHITRADIDAAKRILRKAEEE